VRDPRREAAAMPHLPVLAAPHGDPASWEEVKAACPASGRAPLHRRGDRRGARPRHRRGTPYGTSSRSRSGAAPDLCGGRRGGAGGPGAPLRALRTVLPLPRGGSRSFRDGARIRRDGEWGGPGGAEEGSARGSRAPSAATGRGGRSPAAPTIARTRRRPRAHGAVARGNPPAHERYGIPYEYRRLADHAR